jgi:hypothetical protein
MNEQELRRLIEKYYSGESTGDEEKILRDHFRKGNIPDGYEAEKIIFSYYDESVEVPEPSHDFEAQIMAAIDASGRKNVIKKFLYTALSAAAGLLILGGSYFYFTNKVHTDDTFSDPKIAYAETLKILRDVSIQLNHGRETLHPVVKFSEVTRESFRELNNSAKLAKKSLRELDILQVPIEKESKNQNK